MTHIRIKHCFWYNSFSLLYYMVITHQNIIVNIIVIVVVVECSSRMLISFIIVPLERGKNW